MIRLKLLKAVMLLQNLGHNKGKYWQGRQTRPIRQAVAFLCVIFTYLLQGVRRATRGPLAIALVDLTFISLDVTHRLKLELDF